MGDERLRVLERAASLGGPTARREFLAERVRSGDLSREMLELAAYCGDHDSCLLVGGRIHPTGKACGCTKNDEGITTHGFDCVMRPTREERHEPTARFHMDRWVEGFERWGREAGVRAGVAAARVVMNLGCSHGMVGFCHSDCSRHKTITETIEIIEAVHRDPTNEIHRKAICAAAGQELGEFGLPHGIWFLVAYMLDGGTPSNLIQSCTEAAGATSETIVRDAICSALIEWALS